MSNMVDFHNLSKPVIEEVAGDGVIHLRLILSEDEWDRGYEIIARLVTHKEYLDEEYSVRYRDAEWTLCSFAMTCNVVVADAVVAYATATIRHRDDA